MASITSNATGLASAGGTWVGGVPPVGGDKVTIAAGHVVTLDAAYSWGDDTATGLTIAGTLKASRSVSSSLTVRGQIVLTGTLDFGTEADPIPAAYTATLTYNDSAAMANTKYTVTANTSASTFRAWGAQKAGRTSVSAVSSTTVFDVPDATGWLVGDWLCMGPTSATLSTIDWRAITAIASLGGTAARITVAAAPGTVTAVGRDIANLTRNVMITPQSLASFSSTISIAPTSTSGQIEIGDCEIRGCGAANGASGIGIGASTTPKASVKAIKRVVFHDIASISGSTVTAASVGASTAATLYLMSAAVTGTTGAIDCVFATKNSVNGMAATTAAFLYAVRPSMFGCAALFPNNQFSGSAYGITVNTPYARGFSRVFGNTMVGAASINGGSLGGYASLVSGATINTSLSITGTNLDGGSLGVTNATDIVQADTTNGAASIVIDGCTFPSGGAVARTTNLGLASAVALAYLKNKNADATAQERYTNGGQMYRDNSTYRHGASAVRMDCWYTGQPQTYSFTVKVAGSATLAIRGAMQYSASYGTATPQTVTISGLGITPVVATCPTSGASTWYDYTISATNPTASPGLFTITYTAQSTNNATSTYCWFDGVIDSPWVDVTRHYGYLWDNQTALTADSRIVISEATALALPVAVNHGAQTITVTGAVTNAEVYQACIADLCLAANLTRAVHITSTNGSIFVTTYTVVLSGAGAITGNFTDAVGSRVTITASSIVSGSRVQVYDVTSSTELYNAVLSGAGVTLQATWTTNHTIRLRADKDTKLPVESLGVLTSNGLQFLDTQDDDKIYVNNGIDGSTCSEFTADGSHVQIDISDPDGVTTVTRLYAWLQWYQTTSAGIASVFFGAMTAVDSVSYIIDQALADIQLDNVSGTPVRIIGGYLARKDGTTIIASTSGSIQMDPGKAYEATDSKAYLTALAAIHGLITGSPLTVTSTSRAANGITQMIAEAGGTVTVTRLT